MIQTENQYLFMHKTLFEYLVAKKVAKAECSEFMPALQEAISKPHPTSPTPGAATTPAATTPGATTSPSP